jgi:hypothetical protein
MAVAGCSKPPDFGDMAANVRDKVASDAAEAAFIRNLGPDPHQDSWRANRKLTPLQAQAQAEEKARAAAAAGLTGPVQPGFGPPTLPEEPAKDAQPEPSGPPPPPVIYYYPPSQPSAPPQ